MLAHSVFTTTLQGGTIVSPCTDEETEAQKLNDLSKIIQLVNTKVYLTTKLMLPTPAPSASILSTFLR